MVTIEKLRKSTVAPVPWRAKRYPIKFFEFATALARLALMSNDMALPVANDVVLNDDTRLVAGALKSPLIEYTPFPSYETRVMAIVPPESEKTLKFSVAALNGASDPILNSTKPR